MKKIKIELEYTKYLKLLTDEHKTKTTFNFRVGDVIVYKPPFPKKIVSKFYSRACANRIGRRARITGIVDGLLKVRFYKDREDMRMPIASAKLIKGVPRHPLTTIFK